MERRSRRIQRRFGSPIPRRRPTRGIDALSADEQAAFLAAARAADENLRAFTQGNEAAAYEFLGEQGMEVTLEVDGESFRAATASVLADNPDLFPPGSGRTRPVGASLGTHDAQDAPCLAAAVLSYQDAALCRQARRLASLLSGLECQPFGQRGNRRRNIEDHRRGGGVLANLAVEPPWCPLSRSPGTSD